MKSKRTTYSLIFLLWIFFLTAPVSTSGADALLNPVGNAKAQGICFSLRDQDTHQISGVINSYYPGTANASAGAVAISVGPGQGAGQSIQSGDLLLVIQMQDATIDSSNTSAYGSGGTSGSGYTDPGNSGRYEFVVAASSVDYATGGTLSITGAGNRWQRFRFRYPRSSSRFRMLHPHCNQPDRFSRRLVAVARIAFSAGIVRGQPTVCPILDASAEMVF